MGGKREGPGEKHHIFKQINWKMYTLVMHSHTKWQSQASPTAKLTEKCL